jgi:cobaltochelatase CobS
MTKPSNLMIQLAKHLTVNYEWKNTEHTAVDIKPDGHMQHGKTIRKILIDHFNDADPSLLKSVEAYTKLPAIDALKRIPPVGYLFLAAELLTNKEIIDSILNAPVDSEIIVNQVPEDKFVETLFKAYELLTAAKDMTIETVVDVGGKSVSLPSLGAAEEALLNRVFEGYKIPEWRTITSVVSEASGIKESAKALQKVLNATVKKSKAETDSLMDVIKVLKETYEASKYAAIEAVATGIIPSGKVVMKKVRDVFPGITAADFIIPVWEWDGVHPEVPAKDLFYIFREELLLRSLFAIASNQRMYLQGHTGSGKTTLIEQIAAYLNWPFKRINFDSEITRMDLIGRDTLKEGASVFVDGMLPQMMQGPYIGVFDEIDFCRPDVAYVMQSVLEGNSFRITEDGGREVKPHPMFRMFATGNTVGQGDEHGMYQGARPQSLAFLDRFTVWGKVEYLKEAERKQLIQRHFPMLTEEAVTTINKYATEHLAAFENAKILQPISPRGILAVARAVVHFQTIYGDYNKAIKQALTMSILDRCTASDYATIVGVIDRVVK